MFPPARSSSRPQPRFATAIRATGGNQRQVPGGASRQAVASPEVGLALAAAISSALRDDTHDRRDGVHLFQSCPLPLAILIGHLWNRMPQTQVYEGLGPGGGYIPAFAI
jgi:hypothetical protein